MPRKSTASEMLPSSVEVTLKKLGAHLCLARKRRNETLVSFSERMQVSVPTLRKMEQGNPCVSIAVYAMALWLIGRVGFLSEIANPSNDETALLLEIKNIKRPKGVLCE